MAIVGGRWGVVNGQKFVSSWQVDDQSDTKETVNSVTKAGKHRLPGINSWTGSFESNGAIPVNMPGDMISFEGYLGPDNNTVGSTGVTYSGQAMIERVSITWNWATGDILKTSTEFQGHLGLTYADGQAAIFDTSSINYYGSKQIPTPTVQINNAGGFVNWPNLAQLTLTISNEVQSYVNSSTGGNTGRLAGVFDLDITATEQEVLRSLFQKDDILELKLPVDPTFTNFWFIQYGHVKNFTNIRADRETGAIITQNVEIPWSAFDAESNLGSIKLPGAGSNWWPISGS